MNRNKNLPAPQSLQLQARIGWLTGLGFVFRDVALSQRQEFVLKHVANAQRKGRSTTTIDLSAVLGASTANVGNVLSILMMKGYLTRNDVGDPSGGSLFEYSLVEDLR